MSLLSRHVEIYDFTRGPRVLRCTPGDRDVVHEGLIYQAQAGFKRGRVSQSGEEDRSALELDVPTAFPLLDWFRPFPPNERVRVRLRRVRVSDGFTRTLWSGVLGDIKEGSRTAQIRCQTLLATMNAGGLRRCWQVACPHVLYGPQCTVGRESFRVDGTVILAVGSLLQAAAFGDYPDGWFDGGYVRWTSGTDVEHRFITAHTGTELTLLTPVPADFPVGATVAGYPGCNHSISQCNDKFNNALNYGGQHTIPVHYPFEGNAVF